MPELPEVQTVRQQIDVCLPLKIEALTTSPVVESILKKRDREFNPVGLTIESTNRLGKLLIFNLPEGKKIMSHFGMSGGWRISKMLVVEKHTHVQFKTTDNRGNTIYLAYVDPRRFGNMLFLNGDSAQKYMQKLGVDISGPDFTAEYISSVLKKYPERQLKPFLLDQKYFAGCGNYIACEICARAGIRPTRKAGKITREECERIRIATQEVLDGSLKTNGMTFSGGYVDANGERGEGVSNLVVFYQDTCRLCLKGKVKKIVLAQRGTYYCPKCQK